MKKLCFVAASVSVAMLFASCKQEQHSTTEKIDLNKLKSQLKYVESVVATPGHPVNIPMDSNTAIILTNGDTIFPRWINRKIAAITGQTTEVISGANAATISDNGRWFGDVAHDGSAILGLGFLTPAKCYWPNTYNKLQYSMSPVSTTVAVRMYENDAEYRFLGEWHPGSSIVAEETDIDASLPLGSYQIELTGNKYNGTPYAVISNCFYTYGWQTLPGSGRAYGADMKAADIDGNGKMDVVAMTSNRNSDGVNGISYKFFMDIDNKSGQPAYTTNTQINYMDRKAVKEFAPLGAAAVLYFDMPPKS
jgi:hypothetical protein